MRNERFLVWQFIENFWRLLVPFFFEKIFSVAKGNKLIFVGVGEPRLDHLCELEESHLIINCTAIIPNEAPSPEN